MNPDDIPYAGIGIPQIGMDSNLKIRREEVLCMYCSTGLHSYVYTMYDYVLCGIMLSYVILYVHSGMFWFLYLVHNLFY